MPHVYCATNTETNALDLARVEEPTDKPTFSLTATNIPYTCTSAFPGVIAHHVFAVTLHGSIYKFVAGSWGDTVQDSALIRCYPLADDGPFVKEQVGFLRFPATFTGTYNATTTPTSSSQVTDIVEEAWNLNGIGRNQRWEVQMVFPDGYPHIVAGILGVKPAPLFASERAVDAEERMRVADMGRGTVHR